MGWETRRDGRSYYYRKERGADGRVRSVYCGGESEPLAHLYADAADDARRMAGARRRIYARTFGPIDDALAALRSDVDALRPAVRAYLVATGHRTHRGQWRRAHHLRPVVSAHPPLTNPPEPMARKKNTPTPPEIGPGSGISTDVGAAFTVPEGTDADTLARVAKALDAVDTAKPKPADVSRLRDALGRLPAEAFRPFADRFALRSAATLLAGEANAAAGIVEAEAERFAAELASDGGPLVKAAAAQAACARVILDAVTQSYGSVLRGSYATSSGEHWERRMNAAQRRYLRALATVAALRRAEGMERERAARLDAERDGREAGTGWTSAASSRRPSGDSLPSGPTLS